MGEVTSTQLDFFVGEPEKLAIYLGLHKIFAGLRPGGIRTDRDFILCAASFRLYQPPFASMTGAGLNTTWC